MQPQQQKSGLSTFINTLNQPSNDISSNLQGGIFQNQQELEQKNQSFYKFTQNNDGNEEEAKSTQTNKNQSILFKSISKQSKEPQIRNQNSTNTEQNVPIQNQVRITGAGALLWEKFRLSEDEFKQKQELYKEKPAQREGYTILLFGQKEKKGKFKDLILYTDPGGKIDNNENSNTIASRELFEESCGTFLIEEQHFDIKKSFRMGGSYILFNLLLQTDEKQQIDLNQFYKNYNNLINKPETPPFWLESMFITRIFVSELKSVDLFGAINILALKDVYGRDISIGRRCIAILRALVKSPNVYNFQTNEILINIPVQIKCQQNDDKNLLHQFPWLKETILYQSI